MTESLAERMWTSAALPARAARGALIPLSWPYEGAVALRNFAYDRKWLRAQRPAIPVISIGNLTVGGTGKTPIAAYVAGRLAGLGKKPAIVMRGYGGDEPLVHARLNPLIPVVSDPDRARGVAAAAGRACDVAVLDDGFQHRRMARDVDLVLLSADLMAPARALPAGPWREPLTSLARASFIIVTRKAASPVRARELLLHARRFSPKAGTAIAYLAPDRLISFTSSDAMPANAVRGKRVLVAAAVGDPRAFAAQLRESGAIVELVAERDHYAWSARDAEALARRAAGFDFTVCTLKDAVKLGPVWPRQAPPLWYLSQRVTVESGAAELERILAGLADGTLTNR